MRKKTISENKYYSLERILKKGADYNIIFGERSNGKTYACLYYALQTYLKTGKQTAYIRRWREDLRGKRAESLFSGLVQNGVIETLTKGEYNEVFYYSNKWFLSKYDSETGKRTPQTVPFCYGFSLSEQEHEKSTSFPNITTIIFDEFLTRRYYLPDEFMLYMNLLSTIIRQRDDVKIFMLGNTVNRFCPYFTELGLTNITRQLQGSIDIYRFGDNGAVIAVEYCATIEKYKPSNKYFCFDNEKLQMITGGKWELNAYPRLPVKYKPKDVYFIFFVVFGDNIIQGNVICTDTDSFIFFHAKTTPIKDYDKQLVYSIEPSSLPNVKRKLLSNNSRMEQRITQFFAADKVFYQSNEIGEIIRNYIMTSAKSNILL